MHKHQTQKFWRISPFGIAPDNKNSKRWDKSHSSAKLNMIMLVMSLKYQILKK